MKLLLGLFITVVLVACGRNPDQETRAPLASVNSPPPVISNDEQLEAHVGKVVTVRGLVTNTKIPMIFGVDVSSNNPDLRGQVAEATGLLQKSVVTEEDVAGADYANRGAGVFYRLKDLNSNYKASVRLPMQAEQKSKQ